MEMEDCKGRMKSQKDLDLMLIPDRDITHNIIRFRETLESLAHKLPDNGAKLKANLDKHLRELQRRNKLLQSSSSSHNKNKADDNDDDKEGCEETIQLSDHSDNDDIDNGASNFANSFCKKMDEDQQKDSRIVNYIIPCQGKKFKSKSQLLDEGMGLSSSVYSEKQIISDNDDDIDSDLSFSDMEDVKVYYPSRDEPDAVEVNCADMACLAPKEYISSTIINFYIRCLQGPSESATCKFHFFNTYFYNKLKKLSYEEDSFLKFRKWWKDVHIFEKAYIFLPVHETAHWSLVIICLPNKENELNPILLHLDSLGLHDSMSLFDNIERFLKEEWNYLRKTESPVNLNCRLDHRTVKVPQQKNDYDCGLFVLFYMEMFIKDAPERFKKKDLSMFSRKWFKPPQASKLRAKIYYLLVEEFKKAKEC